MMKSIFACYTLQMLVIIVALVPTRYFASAVVSKPQYSMNTTARNAASNTGIAADTSNDVTYHQGDVLVGTINIYLIFWEPIGNVSPRYNQVIENFFKIVGNTPLYHSLSQYHDSAGRAPSGSHLAGSWTDHRPFLTIPVSGANIEDEIRHAQYEKNWSGNLHNFFIVFDEIDV